MKLRTLIIIAAAVYIIIFAVFVGVYLSTNDPQTVAILSMGVTSALMLFTVIFALLVLHDSPSDRYREKFGDGEEKK